MNPPTAETTEERIALAAAVRQIIGGEARWAYAEKSVWTYTNHEFAAKLRNDWEYLWPDEKCAAIVALYRLTK